MIDFSSEKYSGSTGYRFTKQIQLFDFLFFVLLRSVFPEGYIDKKLFYPLVRMKSFHVIIFTSIVS